MMERAEIRVYKAMQEIGNPVTASQLSEKTKINHFSIKRVLEGLATMGLVEMIKSRRVIIYRLRRDAA